MSYLAAERAVSSSTQNQALNAIVFLYTAVMKRDPGDFSDFTHAKMQKRRPDTLSREQVTALIDALEMPHKLMAVICMARDCGSQSACRCRCMMLALTMVPFVFTARGPRVVS